LLVLSLMSTLAACGGAKPPRTCSATFSGNFEDHTEVLANCPRIEHDAVANQWVFKFNVASVKGNTTEQGNITLGANATATSLASDTAADWVASATREPGCVYSAGIDAIPVGSFNLTLATVDTASGEASGTLELHESVHAQPTVDCGPGDEEVLVLDF